VSGTNFSTDQIDDLGKLAAVDEVPAVGELNVAAAELRRHEPRLRDRDVWIVGGVVDGDPLLMLADLLPLPLGLVVAAGGFEAVRQLGA
jgi:hypothetical protein